VIDEDRDEGVKQVRKVHGVTDMQRYHPGVYLEGKENH